MARPAAARLHCLDGLRGWAALGVLAFHAAWEFFGTVLPTGAYPALSVLSGGRLSVSVFFVLTGVVLSYPVIQTGDMDRVRRAFVGRYVRLAIPIVAAGLINLVLVRAGLLYNREAATILHSSWLGSLADPAATVEQFGYFVLVGAFSHPQSSMTFGPFLWTMHYELFGSALIFMILLIAQDSVAARRVLGAVALGYALVLWTPVAPFLYGMVIAELMSVRAYPRIRANVLARVAGPSLLLVAAGLTYAYRPDFFAGHLNGLFAAMVVLAVILSIDLQRLLEVRLSLWLGHISFPLYLVHGSVLVSLSSYLVVGYGPGRLGLAEIAAIVGVGMAVSLTCAQLLSPIEAFAVRTAHLVARLVLTSRDHARTPVALG